MAAAHGETGPGAPQADHETTASAGVGAAWTSGSDLLALLDSLGVASGGIDDDLDTVLAAEPQMLDAGAAGDWSAAWIAEHMPAGPGLAALLADSAQACASDWELPGIAASFRRLASWAQSGELAAVAEIASRSAATNPRIGAGDDGRPNCLPPEAAAQVALAMQMSQPGASDWVDLAMQMRWRLPATGAALSAGTIDLPRARIIAEGTSVLPDELAGAVEGRVLPGAADQTTGQLRGSVRRAVLAADPEGAEQRRKDTERGAKISLYPDEQGTATLTGSCLPGVHAAAVMARISAMARAWKASGAQGGLDLLRAHIFIGLLLGTMPLIPPPADGPPDNPSDDTGPDNPPAGDGADEPPSGDSADEPPSADGTEDPPAGDGRWSPPAHNPPEDDPSVAAKHPADDSGLAVDDCGCERDCPADQDCPADRDRPPGPQPDVPWPTDADAPPDDGELSEPESTFCGRTEDTEDDDRAESPSPDWPTLPALLPAAGSAPSAKAAAPRPPVGLLDILVPWSALAGYTSEPGRLNRIGPITSLQTLQLLVLAAGSPQTEWRVVVTDDDGRALAVERARPGWHVRTGGDGTQTTGVVGRVTIAIRESWLGTPCAAAPLGRSPTREIAAMVLRAADRAAARARAERQANAQAGGCAHVMASDSYRPPPRIRDFVGVRDKTCRFTTCGQPAWRADLDHTVPWHKGGLTCPCNLGGCCRTHHKIKQLPGWRLEQPRPGAFRWTTPAGRSYLVEPEPYPA